MEIIVDINENKVYDTVKEFKNSKKKATFDAIVTQAKDFWPGKVKELLENLVEKEILRVNARKNEKVASYTVTKNIPKLTCENEKEEDECNETSTHESFTDEQQS